MIEAVIKAGATVVNILTLPDIVFLMSMLPRLNISKNMLIILIMQSSQHTVIMIWVWQQANTLSGVLNSHARVEVTINGIGEHAGHPSLEEIAMILKCHKGIGIDTI